MGRAEHTLEWEWDEGNLRELARHKISARTVYQVAEGEPRFRANRRGRAATHQMIGPDDGDRFWVVCILCVDEEEQLWRAVTGWPAREQEIAWYRRSR